VVSAIGGKGPLGTHLARFWLLWALISGRFLRSRGAVFPALAALGFPADAVRRSGAALPSGGWTVQPLLEAWRPRVQEDGRWRAPTYAGGRPVACALLGFCRPQLPGCGGKPDQAGAEQAVPALGLAVVAAVGSVGAVRRPRLRLLLRADPDTSRAAELQRRAVPHAGAAWPPNAGRVVDAGCRVAALLTAGGPRGVARVARHLTARRHGLPASHGRGRRPASGESVRPVPRIYQGKPSAAPPWDAAAQWAVAGRIVRAAVWHPRGLATATPGAAAGRWVVIQDPRYRHPLGWVTHLPVSA
jgi:hypothetical protein